MLLHDLQDAKVRNRKRREAIQIILMTNIGTNQSKVQRKR
jgi:hypothetical protein